MKAFPLAQAGRESDVPMLQAQGPMLLPLVLLWDLLLGFWFTAPRDWKGIQLTLIGRSSHTTPLQIQPGG